MIKDDAGEPGGTAPADPSEPDGGPNADRASFLRRLGKFPSFFLDEYVPKASKSRLQGILQTLTDSVPLNEDKGCDPELEAGVKSHNVPAFLLWTLGKKKEAEERAARAVQENPCQLLALSNIAYILWHNGKNQEAEQYLSTMERLKEAEDPSVYDELDYQAQAELAYFYTRISHTFEPFFLSDLHERLLARRPEDQHAKLRLAMTLHRHTSYFWSATFPHVDLNQLISKAADLFLEIKKEKRNCRVLRGLAAARLGEILNVNESERERLDLTAKDCFKDAVALSGDTPSVLIKAGRFYRDERNVDFYVRYHDLQRSKELLERAITVRPEARAYYQLGLTLHELALQRAGFKPWQHDPNPRQRGRGRPRQTFRGGSKRTSCLSETESEWDGMNKRFNNRKDVPREERSYKQQSSGQETRRTARTSSSPKLSSSSVEVQQAIDSFEMAVELQCGKQMIALLNLGLIFKNMHNHKEALRYFIQVIEKWPTDVLAHKAIEHAGKTVQNMVINRFDHEPQTTREAAEETSEFCFTINLSLQYLVLLKMSAFQASLNPAAWDSLKNVKQVLTQDSYFFQHIKQFGKLEKKLLNSLRSHFKTLPALKLLCSFGFTQARKPDFVWDQIHGLHKGGMLADELLLLCLYYLTLQNSGQLHFNGFEAKLCMSLATDRWIKALSRKPVKDSSYQRLQTEDILMRLNLAVARVLFIQGFQLGILRMKNSRRPVCDLSFFLETLDLSEASPVERNGRFGRSEQSSKDVALQKTTQSRPFQAEAVASKCEEDEDDTDGLNDLHILFVYDPRDLEVGRAVSTMRTLLDTVCGLKTSCWSDLGESERPESSQGKGVSTERTWPETGAVETADLRVLVVGQKAVSTAYKTLIQRWTEDGKDASATASPLPPAREVTPPPLSKVLLLRPTPLPDQGGACTWQVPSKSATSRATRGTTESDVRAAHGLLFSLLGLHG